MSYISTIRKDDKVYVWERGPQGRTVKTYNAQFYFYKKDPNGKYESILGDRLSKYEFPDFYTFQYEVNKLKNRGEQLFESDILPEQRVLSDYYYEVEPPPLNVTFLDIEVDYDRLRGFASVDNPYAPINSVALYHQWQNKYVLLTVPPQGASTENLQESMNVIDPLPTDSELEIQICSSEIELLMWLLAEIEDSDVLSGWNSEFFDLPYIAKRLGNIGPKTYNRLSFPDAYPPRPASVEKMGKTNSKVVISGRIALDYLDLYRKYEMGDRPSYKLESIADQVLPDMPKLEYEGSLADLYQTNFPYFLRYNLRDTEILKGFEDRLGYVALANTMAHISTGTFDNVLGTIKLSELAINNYCWHVLGKQVPDIPRPENAGIQGALVLDPKVDMHEWIGSVDINSLYPSAIRSLNVSPETIIGQFAENTKASQEIAKESTNDITLVYENGKKETHSAFQWRQILQTHKWAVSGFGTVFDQKHQGIIPTVLEDWYNTRKKYQKMKKQATDNLQSAYYDRLQYVYKIKLNSLYGALSNRFFRFFDTRMGESTTGTGRMVLQHQCCEVNRLITGVYDLYGDAIIYGDSVASDTIIITPNSKCEIKQLFEQCHKTEGDKEYYFPSNLQALTFDEQNNTSCFKPVKYVMRHKVNKQMFRVWISNTNYIDVTEDHSLIGYKNSNIWSPGESRFIEIKPQNDNKNARNLIYLKHIPRTNIVSRNYPKCVYELMGYIIGDGYIGKGANEAGLSIGKQDVEEISSKLLQPLVDQNVLTSFKVSRNKHDVSIRTKRFWQELLRASLYPNGVKSIPSWLALETEENIAHFLRGYFSADGSAGLTGGVGISSIKREFIEQVQELLFYCGISSNFFKEGNENHYKGKPLGTYNFVLHVKDSALFRQKIGFLQNRKHTRIKTTRGIPRKYLQNYGYSITRCTKIEPITYSDFVYDLEIEDTHTFFANNILVHNTDSTYFKTFAETKDEAILIADTIADQVNKSFPQFMRQTFLCQPGYDDIIRCGREVVSDRGIFVDKKRYILHVVDNEGVPADKLKVMGLDTKKTTMPKVISVELNKFIERLLKGDSWDNVANDIVEYKDELLQNEDVRVIGLPKGIMGIEEYTKKYEIAEKQAAERGEKNNCVLPGHIAAAICYNKCLDKFNDKASLRITSGMKIKVFYLTHILFDRFTSIALPTDIEVIPNWFYDNCEIDKEKHITRLVDNPLRNIIKAINRIPPNKQERVFTSIVGDDVSFESMRTTRVKKEKVSNEAQNTVAETIFGVVVQEEDPKQVHPVVDDTAAQKHKQNKLADDIFGL